MTKNAPIIISRSAVATRKLCEMKRYRAYHQRHPDFPPEAQVGGLSPLDDDQEGLAGWAKTRGQLIHGALDLAVAGGDWQTWLATQPPFLPEPFGLPAEQQKRWLTLIRRVVLGWLHVRWAELSPIYERVSSEQEWQWAMHPLVIQSLRMDQIWRRKSDGHLLIVDFKTVGGFDANWADRLRHSDQTHLYIQALVERSGQPVIGIQYEGLILGKVEKDGWWGSPWIRGYIKSSQTSVSPKWMAGSTKYSLYHWADADVLTWLEQHAMLNEQFVTTGALYPPPSQLLQTRDATAQAEIQWADRMAQLEACAAQFGPESSEHHSLLGRLVERSSDACLKYGWGYACPYMGLCWEGAQPDADTFQPRIDHHDEQPKATTTG